MVNSETADMIENCEDKTVSISSGIKDDSSGELKQSEQLSGIDIMASIDESGAGDSRYVEGRTRQNYMSSDPEDDTHVRLMVARWAAGKEDEHASSG